ncbi:MAG: DUF3459 domain-containing protein [Candidatus Sericytochromatia bacterium]|nr:DUF3459 domain-containing protein [Candidatus Sericytochromatia bacterium]
MCGAPWRNDFRSEPVDRLQLIQNWIPHLKSLGVTAVYIGPLWESSSHGYDTVSYFDPDRRLGSHVSLQHLIWVLHENGLKVVLDAVLNHVSRDFFAFRSVRQHLQRSPYYSWFENLSFKSRNKRGDPFQYEGWKGHDDLVKLNLQHPDVQQHLFEALRQWIKYYGIDGLRLDAADCMDKAFLKSLKAFGRKLRPDFWMMGEVVMGDYRDWQLDSITNYELYDSLHKAHNTRDYRRLAQTLERQYGKSGVYRNLPLYNFLDNHDVNRIASLLRRHAHLYPAHILLFSLPGIPSLYYGSEAGLEGKRLKFSDRPLRPFLPHPDALKTARHPDLLKSVQKLIQIRRSEAALRQGDYQTLFCDEDCLVFVRRWQHECLIVAVNGSREVRRFELPAAWRGHSWQDRLNAESLHNPQELVLYPHWGRILKRQNT